MSTPTVNTKIWLALEAGINDMAGSVSVAWPATLFDVNNAMYYRVAYLPAQPDSPFIKNDTPHIRTGSLVVTVVHPMRNGYNVAMFQEYAGKVAEYFAEGESFRYGDVCVSVSAAPFINPGYEDDGYWNIPVSVSWRCVA